jgi:hypothetical protein
MADFSRQFVSHAEKQDKSQPRFLSRWEPAQPCNWTECPATATHAHKDQFYCARHLLKTLQQQWQE